MSWRLLAVLTWELVRDPSTALFRELRGEWGPWHGQLQTNVLMARLTHASEVANWQRGADKNEAQSRKHYPEPIYLPGQKAAQKPGVDTKRFGRARMSIEQAKKWLGW